MFNNKWILVFYVKFDRKKLVQRNHQLKTKKSVPIWKTWPAAGAAHCLQYYSRSKMNSAERFQEYWDSTILPIFLNYNGLIYSALCVRTFPAFFSFDSEPMKCSWDIQLLSVANPEGSWLPGPIRVMPLTSSSRLPRPSSGRFKDHLLIEGKIHRTYT